MTRRFRPFIEQLERRDTPATWGNAWPVPQSLTLSFAADGVRIGNRESNLFESMNAQFHGDTTAWQTEILIAFQSWAVHAGLNVGLQTETDLSPLGTTAIPQVSSRFGDIRVVGFEMSADVLAINVPFDLSAGTWAGDLLINTRYIEQMQNPGELQEMLLNEAGNILGLYDSNDPRSALYEYYQGQLACLTADDINALKRIYGERRPDSNEGVTGNDTLEQASAISKYGFSLYGQTGDLTTTADVDYFRFQTTSQGEATVRLQTSEISFLTARLTVLDAAGNELASTAASDPLHGDLKLQLGELPESSTYYIKVEKAREDVFAVGSYRLFVEGVPTAAQAELNASYAAVQGTLDRYHLRRSQASADLMSFHSGTVGATSETAIALKQNVSLTTDHALYMHGGSIGPVAPSNYFRVTVPTWTDGGKEMDVAVWALDPQSLDPEVDVYDHLGRVVPAKIFHNESGTLNVRLSETIPGETYVIRIYSAETPSSASPYLMTVNFTNVPLDLETLLRGNVVPKQPIDRTLVVEETQILGLLLSAQGTNDSLVRMTILDADNKVVEVIFSNAGETNSRNLFIEKGVYTLCVEAVGAESFYVLEYNTLSDSISPFEDEGHGSHTATPQDAQHRLYLVPQEKCNRPATVEPVADAYWSGFQGEARSFVNLLTRNSDNRANPAETGNGKTPTTRSTPPLGNATSTRRDTNAGFGPRAVDGSGKGSDLSDRESQPSDREASLTNRADSRPPRESYEGTDNTRTQERRIVNNAENPDRTTDPDDDVNVGNTEEGDPLAPSEIHENTAVADDDLLRMNSKSRIGFVWKAMVACASAIVGGTHFAAWRAERRKPPGHQPTV